MVVAGGGELLDGFRAERPRRGVGARVHFLGARPPRRAARRPPRLRPLRADDRAAGVVRHRPDRGDGLRAAGARHRLPRRARRRRRGRDRAAGPAGDSAAAAEALDRFVDMGAEGRERIGAAGRAKAERGGLAARCSTGWRTPTRRRSPARREESSMSAGRRILLVSYFYPPTRDTGRAAARGDGEVAAPARAGRDRADDERLRATTATDGASRWSATARHADLAGAAARATTGRLALRLRHLLGQAAPAQQGDRARAAGARLGAVRAPRAAAASPRALRLRAHHLAARVGPRGRRWRSSGAACAWVADVRDAWTFEPLRPAFPTAAQRRLDERLERRWLGARRRGRLRQPSRPPPTCARAGSPTRC